MRCRKRGGVEGWLLRGHWQVWGGRGSWEGREIQGEDECGRGSVIFLEAREVSLVGT